MADFHLQLIRLTIKEIWSPDLIPPATGLPPDTAQEMRLEFSFILQNSPVGSAVTLQLHLALHFVLHFQNAETPCKQRLF